MSVRGGRGEGSDGPPPSSPCHATDPRPAIRPPSGAIRCGWWRRQLQRPQRVACRCSLVGRQTLPGYAASVSRLASGRGRAGCRCIGRPNPHTAAVGRPLRRCHPWPSSRFRCDGRGKRMAQCAGSVGRCNASGAGAARCTPRPLSALRWLAGQPAIRSATSAATSASVPAPCAARI